MSTTFSLHLAGLAAILGAFIYAIGDVFLLAGQAKLADYPKLQPHAKLLSDAEKMVALPWWRVAWGGLLGVFATPLVLAGFWMIYQGLRPAGTLHSLAPFILFACATIVGAFVHGSFIYLAEYVQALNQVSDDSQPVILAMFKRHRTILVITYFFLLICIVIASIWFALVVGFGTTAFPRWVAFANPVLAFIMWLLIKKILPKALTQHTEGAGFNIAYLAFFTAATVALW